MMARRLIACLLFRLGCFIEMTFCPEEVKPTLKWQHKIEYKLLKSSFGKQQHRNHLN